MQKILFTNDDCSNLILEAKFLHELNRSEYDSLKENRIKKIDYYNSKNYLIDYDRILFLKTHKKDSNWAIKLNEFVKFYNNNQYGNLKRNFHIKNLNTWIDKLNLHFALFVLHKVSNNVNNNIINDNISNNIIEFVCEKIYRLVINVIAVELNLSRNENTISKFNKYSGFNIYFKKLIKYPVLMRFVFIEVFKIIDFFSLLLNRVYKDIDEISKVFSDNKITKLVGISSTLSDSHNNGNYVVKLTFNTGVAIMYKPKSLYPDKFYNELINSVNRTINKKLNKIILLNRGKYGYTEFVEYKSCQNKSEVKDYYYRIGIHLGLTYSFNGNDFHYENIIANASQPYLIDLETLIFNHGGFVSEIDNGSASNLVELMLRKSVAGTGILPYYQYGDIDKEGYDVSGLGGEKNQKYPKESIKWINVGETNMKAVYSYGYIKPHKNIPLINEIEQNPFNFLNHIIKGFEDAYNIILNNKNYYLEKLDSFSENKMRHIMRPTKIYYQLLERILHPSLLKNGIDCSIELEVLNRAMKHKKEAVIVQSEIEQICNFDIPIFYHDINKRVIYSTHEKLLSDYFNFSSLFQAKEKINNFNKNDLDTQISLIKSTIHNKTNSVFLVKPNFQNNEQQYINNLITGKYNTVNWLSYLFNGKYNSYSIAPLNRDLYSGIIGVLIGYVSYCNNKNLICHNLLKYIKGTYDSFLSVSFNSLISKLGYGVYNGAYSILNGLLYLQENKTLKDYELIFPSINNINLFKNKNVLDYEQISGVSGVLMFLCYIHERKAINNFHTIKYLSNEILGNYSFKHDKTGFAHGNAGIGYSLIKAGNIIADENMKQQGLSFILKDLKIIFNSKQNINISWCKGISGICLALLKSGIETKEIQLKIKEITIAIIKNYKKSDTTDTLCCGTFGVIDTIIELLNSNYLFLKPFEVHLIEIVNGFFNSNRNLKMETPNFGIPNLSLFRGVSGYFYLKNRKNSSKISTILIR